VKTDHYNLKYLLDQCLTIIPQHQWISKLIGYDFWVQYKPGTSNTVADALSRRDAGEEGQSAMVSAPVFAVFDELRVETATKASLQQMKEEVLAGRKGDEWQFVDGLVTVRGKVYVATDSPSLPAILTAAHGMGHEGIEKTLHRLRRDFFIPGATAAVKEHVQACVICQRNKVIQQVCCSHWRCRAQYGLT
jgi:hypothetical protein